MAKVILIFYEINCGGAICVIRNAVEFVHYLLQEKVSQADYLVDGTCGNGQDTKYLLSHAKATARILAMDIQQSAIDRTRQRVNDTDCSTQVKVVKDSHENIDQYFHVVDVALFNLGYLPGGDHQLTTTAQSTIIALQRLLPLLRTGGIVGLVAYPGHPSGFLETKELDDFSIKLSQQQYHVGCFKLLNQVNQPPILYLIEKIGSETSEGFASR
jgi:hypothetical protein